MEYMNDRPSGLKVIQDGIVEVKVWEAFLLHNRNNVYGTLSTYAIDNGPVGKRGGDLNFVTFRFTTWDWNNTLKKLLSKHNIPVISEATLGRESILR